MVAVLEECLFIVPMKLCDEIYFSNECKFVKVVEFVAENLASSRTRV
jgi:hypothetical protein